MEILEKLSECNYGNGREYNTYRCLYKGLIVNIFQPWTPEEFVIEISIPTGGTINRKFSLDYKKHGSFYIAKILRDIKALNITSEEFSKREVEIKDKEWKIRRKEKGKVSDDDDSEDELMKLAPYSYVYERDRFELTSSDIGLDENYIYETFYNIFRPLFINP